MFYAEILGKSVLEQMVQAMHTAHQNGGKVYGIGVISKAACFAPQLWLMEQGGLFWCKDNLDTATFFARALSYQADGDKQDWLLQPRHSVTP